MTGRVEELTNVIEPDQRAVRVTERWQQWETLRQVKKVDWEEVIRYVYATDTTKTTNAQLPWKNKTTVPKLCQIRDNLYSNYTATMFPKRRKNVIWEAANKDSNSVDKKNAIENYMTWVMEQPQFKHEFDKILIDYIDRGNCFATVEWIDERVEQPGFTQVGFVGPMVKRINPLDINMNPTSENFVSSPKIVRTVTSMGELRKYLDRISNDQNREANENLWNYLKNVRFRARTFEGDWIQRDHLYNMDGFTSFRAYLQTDFVEVLTFYGDYYDYVNDVYQSNRVITVVDRHKLIYDEPNPSFFGYPPIFHVPWRKKPDNLWGMGPLDNLVGLQYRIDHLENMAADVWDLCTYPVQKVKGFVEEYIWQPGEKIFLSEEGDVELVTPDVNLLQADQKIAMYQALMEEMAGAPKEAMGFRTPGEKTKYEVQRLENAASRLYQNKINQFQEQMQEPILNAMLELARRNLSGPTTIKVFDNEFNLSVFQTLTPEDITGIGRIRPIGARHFAEQAELIQNLTALTGSNLWPTVQPHFSGVKLAKMLEATFDLEDYDIVMPFIALAEQAEGQKQQQVLEEMLQRQTMTPTGMGSDYDQTPAPQAPGQNNQPVPSPKPAMGLRREPSATAQPPGILSDQ